MGESVKEVGNLKRKYKIKTNPTLSLALGFCDHADCRQIHAD